MAMCRRTRLIQYALAWLVPMICCLIVRVWVLPEAADPGWLLADGRAFGILILFYPVIEELSFRGVIQGVLLKGTHRREMLPGITVANGITSLLFTAIHFVHHPPVWAAAVVVPSLIFGYFRDRFESVVPAVILHIFYNLIFYATVGK